MANTPYRNPILNAIYRTARQRPSIKSLLNRNSAQRTILQPDDRWSREQRFIYEEMRPSLEREAQNGFFVMTSDELMRGAQKSLSFNQYVLDFINDAGYRDNYRYYDRGTLENAYRTSVFLFAFLRFAADMISTVNIVAEKKQGEVWMKTPEDEPINQIFAEQGSEVFFRGYMNYAIYGQVLIYMHKTADAVLRWAHGDTEAGTYAKGGLAGFHVISGRNYDLDVDYSGQELRGFHLGTQETGMNNRNYLRREECVYLWDFDPKDDWRGTSIVNAAIHNAVTNAAIAKWASHYFTTGAMPMILVSAKGTDPYAPASTDIQREKYKFEQNWRGVGASMRAHFTERQVQVDQVGIEADKVAAPELNRTALEGISAATRIPVDLIIPPQGGSDNARHKHLMMQVWQDTILPLADQFAAAFNRDIGMPEGMRLLVDRSAIDALKSDRGDRAQTEISITSGGLQSFNEARTELDMPTVRPMRGMLNIGGQWRSVRSIRVQDRLLGATLPDLTAAWTENLITRGQWHDLLGLPLPMGVQDGYKFEIVQESSTGGMADDLIKVEAVGPEALLPQPKQPFGSGPEPNRPTGPTGGGFVEGPPEPEPTPLTGGGVEPPAAEPAPVTASFDVNGERSVEGKSDSLSVKAVSVGAPEMYVVAHAQPESIESLKTIQSVIAAMFPPEAIVRLSEPDNLHVTLWYVPVFGEEEETLYFQQLPAEVPVTPFIVRGLNVFEKDGGTICIYGEVSEADGEREALDSLRALFAPPLPEERLSSYSTKWIPHITLGYATNLPDGFDATAIFGEQFALHLKVGEVEVSRGEGRTSKRVPVAGTLPEAPELGQETPFPDAPVSLSTETTESLESPESANLSHSDLLTLKMNERAVWKAGLERGASYHDPAIAMLPKLIKDSLSAFEAEGVDYDSAKAAVMGALAAGWYDEDAVPDENPAKAYLVGAAKGDWKSELDAWERSALRNWNKAVNRFVTYHVPPSVADGLRASLKETDRRDKAAIHALFAGVRDAMGQKSTRMEHVAAWAKQIWDAGDDELKSLFD